MARKRLSDLLREEVQKPAEPEPAAESPKSTSSQGPKEPAIANNGHAAELEAAADREAQLQQQVTDLQQQIDQLKSEAQTQSNLKLQMVDLEQQIADLKTESKTQLAATQKLQASLATAEQRNQQLDAELKEAKQTVLQLADSNAELKQQLESIQKTQLTRSQPAKPATAITKPAPTSPSKPDDKLASKPLSQQEVLRRQADSLAHPMFPIGKSPGQLSDQDIGWVD